MKSLIAKHFALVATAIVTTGLTVNHASAASEYGEPKNVVVHYSDLNLSEPKDVHTLYARIRIAARESCDVFGSVGLLQLQQFHKCVDWAVSNAVAAVSSQRLTEIHEAQVHHLSRS
jgi:UrcA family protein